MDDENMPVIGHVLEINDAKVAIALQECIQIIALTLCAFGVLVGVFHMEYIPNEAIVVVSCITVSISTIAQFLAIVWFGIVASRAVCPVRRLTIHLLLTLVAISVFFVLTLVSTEALFEIMLRLIQKEP